MAKIDIAKIIAQMQKAQSDANAANESRYTQGLSELTGARTTLQGLYDQAQSMVQGLGQSAITDANRSSTRAGAATRQQLISSGLGNTTIVGSMMRGNEEDRQRAMERINEQQASMRAGLATQRAGAQMGASGSIADFIAARNDVGPDPGLYSSLIQAAAAGQEATKPTTVFGGLGPNARAGLDAFGDPMGRYGGGGSGGGSGGGDIFGGGSGGGGGGGGGSARYIPPRSGGGGLSTGGPTSSWGPGGTGGISGAIGGGGLSTGGSSSSYAPSYDTGLATAWGPRPEIGGAAPISAAPRSPQPITAGPQIPRPASMGEAVKPPKTYDEYVKRVGRRNAVSPMYWSKVHRG